MWTSFIVLVEKNGQDNKKLEKVLGQQIILNNIYSIIYEIVTKIPINI